MTLKPAISITVLFVLGVSAKLSGQECKQAVVSGEIRGEASYSRALSDSLELRLRPLKQHWGWLVSVSPVGSDKDWTFPVTFPIRTGQSQTFGTGYDFTARERLKWPARVNFVVTEIDYDRYSHLAYETLESADPDAAGRYITAIKNVTVGHITIEATDYDKSGGPEVVQWMKFKATIVVPNSFLAVTDLKWSSIGCPPHA